MHEAAPRPLPAYRGRRDAGGTPERARARDRSLQLEPTRAATTSRRTSTARSCGSGSTAARRARRTDWRRRRPDTAARGPLRSPATYPRASNAYPETRRCCVRTLCGFAHPVQHAFQVDGDLAINQLVGRFRHRREQHDASIVDQHIDGAHITNNLSNTFLCRFKASYIARVGAKCIPFLFHFSDPRSDLAITRRVGCGYVVSHISHFHANRFAKAAHPTSD